MEKKWIVILFAWIAVCASADPFNTYQWNRRNFTLSNGKVDSGDWFEWWYYKVVGPRANDAFFFIYGVVNPQSKPAPNQVPKAYIMMGNYANHELLQSDFPTSDFFASYEKTEIKIGRNQASDRHLSGRFLHPDGGEVKWDLSIDPRWAYNAMGWAINFADIVNIFWYPAQASAVMTGTIDYRGEKRQLEKLPAYQDRNWGRSFPEWWAWLVANHFPKSPGTVLAAGGGKPKLLGTFEPEGLSIGFLHRGKEYVFRPNDGDSLSVDVNFGKWEVRAKNSRGQKIEISATAPAEDFLTLPFMTPKGQTFYDHEALRGKIRVRLYERPAPLLTYQTVADVTTEEGGIEFGSADPSWLKRTFTESRTLF